MDIHRRKEHNSDHQMDVWERFVSGDISCFELIFKKYYKEMYGYGLKLCDQPELVEDCVQELFKTVWEKRDDLTHVDSPRVYLFVSLRRKVLRNLKRQDKFSAGLDEISESPAIKFGIEEIIIRNESRKQQREALQKALNQLTNRQKEIIYLHFYNGMSHGEIEKILSINRQSVWNHMYRAMETLRATLNTEVMKLVITLLISFLLFLP